MQGDWSPKRVDPEDPIRRAQLSVRQRTLEYKQICGDHTADRDTTIAALPFTEGRIILLLRVD